MTTNEETDEVEFFRSRSRCLFPIEGIQPSRSLRRTLKRGNYQFRVDTAFPEVMRACLRPPGDNWISENFIRVYTQIFNQGWAHSGEVWADGELVGGVYGVAIGRVFSAESMFHRQTDMSKVALVHMIDWCRNHGFTVFDAQILNPHLASLGAYTVPDKQYMKLLTAGLSQTPKT